ncbi:glucosaminidase domain-containing protein [Sphingomonas sp. ASY06-1R]|uniref:glucosaminidase domain-containing protein n=1 Tax=Sphingomonas sp. ASY06-1R TaxID=3445771 RepID=UPI003FA308DD
MNEFLRRSKAGGQGFDKEFGLRPGMFAGKPNSLSDPLALLVNPLGALNLLNDPTVYDNTISPNAINSPIASASSGRSDHPKPALLPTADPTRPMAPAGTSVPPVILDRKAATRSQAISTPRYRQPPPEMIAAAQHTQRVSGIPASVTLAQWATESHWGGSMPPNSNNAFGIKEYDKSKGVISETREYDSKGNLLKQKKRFKTFPTLQDGWNAHTNLLTKDKRYVPALKFGNDPDKYIDAIAPIYAPGNPQYSPSIKAMMKANRLYQYNDLPDDSSPLNK